MNTKMERHVNHPYAKSPTAQPDLIWARSLKISTKWYLLELGQAIMEKYPRSLNFDTLGWWYMASAVTELFLSSINDNIWLEFLSLVWNTGTFQDIGASTILFWKSCFHKLIAVEQFTTVTPTNTGVSNFQMTSLRLQWADAMMQLCFTFML